MNRKIVKRTLAGLAVGAVGIIAVAVVAIPRHGNSTTTVSAQFDNSIGLYPGNAVSVLGMQVGKVASITSKGTYVEVVLDIDASVDIPADVQAVTVSTSILTDRHIELTPVYRGGPKLKNGDVVGMARTRTPVEFDKSLAMIDRLSRSLGGDGQGQGPLASLIGIGSDITTSSGQEIKATLDQLAQALRLGSDGGSASQKNIQAIVKNLAELMQAATDNDSAIRQFGAELHQVSDVLAAEQLGTGDTGKKINSILAQATSLLQDNRDTITDTVGSAEELSNALVEYRRELAEVLDVAPLALDNLYNGIDANAGAVRLHIAADKLLVNGQFSKEVCNLLQLKQLGCATGTLLDYGPDFGLASLLDLMAGSAK